MMNTIRYLIHPIVIQLTRFRVRCHIAFQNEIDIVFQQPVIYAVNHTNSCDIPVTCRVVRRHCHVLIGKQRLYLSDRLFFFLNGAIWVDRKDKQDMHRSKERIMEHLRSGQSLIWFPEGTWNLTDHLLMLPMKWGIIDCAQKCHVPIVPVALEYKSELNQCVASIGQPIMAEGMSLEDGITILRDKMAELRWEIWEQQGVTKRCDLDPVAEREKIHKAVDDYPPLDLEYEQSVVFNPYQYVVFDLARSQQDETISTFHLEVDSERKIDDLSTN